MTASLDSLRAPLTADQIRARVMSGLQGAGFPTSDWAPTAQGGLESGIVDMAAGAIADLVGAGLGAAIDGGFLDLAAGDWLTFLAQQFFLLDRNPATKTVQAITLICSRAAGPYTVQPGELVVIGAGSITGANRYRNTEGGTIPSGAGTADVPAVVLQFEAENPGSAYDDAPGTVVTLVTSFPGVAVKNSRILTPSPAALMTGSASTGQIFPSATPGFTPSAERYRLLITVSGQGATAPFAQCMLSLDDGKTYQGPFFADAVVDLVDGSRITFVDSPFTNPSFVAGDVFFWANTSILAQGSDEESDARLAARCRARWLTLSDVPTSGTVELWAKAAAPEVARVRVLADPNAALKMLVYLGSSAGRASPGTVVAVQEYITARLEPPEAANVFSVDTRAVAVTGNVKVPRLKLADVQTAAEKNWTAYLASLDIGGTVRLAELEQAVMDAGALDYSSLALTGGAPNLTLGTSEVAVPPDGSTLLNALLWEPV